jgi:hypothetical protein
MAADVQQTRASPKHHVLAGKATLNAFSFFYNT